MLHAGDAGSTCNRTSADFLNTSSYGSAFVILIALDAWSIACILCQRLKFHTSPFGTPSGHGLTVSLLLKNSSMDSYVSGWPMRS